MAHDAVFDAIMSKRAFDKIAAGLDDALAYSRAMKAIASGEDELVPADIAQRLIAGEVPLRVWREYRGLTQEVLADRSSLSRVEVANIEAGAKTGSAETLKMLAVALGVSLDDLT